MSAKALLLVALAFAIIFILRLRQRLALLAEQVRGLRERALERITYRPAPKDARMTSRSFIDRTEPRMFMSRSSLRVHLREALLVEVERLVEIELVDIGRLGRLAADVVFGPSLYG
jgi:hypothetical protein